MEGPEADEHYTERLVRLSNLAVYYEPPAVNKIGMRRAGIGVPDDAAVYWCCQFLSKYPPQYDSIFARIAKRVRQARFVFIRYQHGACVVEILEERLRRAFAEEGLSSSEHCIFLPPMDFGRFNAVAQLSDVYLDSIGWSGCDSLLEAIAWNLPPVILPSSLMRGRHAVAIMAMMGVTETIASNLDDYVDIAVRLGLSSGERTAVSARIAENKHKVYRDISAVRSLETFIATVVEHGIEAYTQPARSPLALSIDQLASA
ncbi:MAG: hypothetical protein WA791_16745 [Rhodomicrobium sp.]